MALYQEINNIPGLAGGNSFSKQKQLYERLGAPQGGYTGSYGQNVWLLDQIHKGNYGSTPTPTPAVPSAPATPQAPVPSPVQQTSSAIDTTLTNDKTARDQKYQGFRDSLTGLLKDYQGAVPGIVNEAENKYQVGNLSTLTQSLNNRIKDLQLNSSGGADGYASSGQVDQAVNSRYLPQYNAAVENLNQGSSLAQNEINQKIDPYKLRVQTISDQIAREMTGFDHGQQSELDALVQKLQTFGTLENAEKDRLSALALKEAEFENGKQMANIQAGNELKNSMATIGASKSADLNNQKAIIAYQAEQAAKVFNGGTNNSSDPLGLGVGQ